MTDRAKPKAKQKKTAASPVVTRTPGDAPMFVTWEEGDEKGRTLAMRACSESLARAEKRFGSNRAKATDVYKNIVPGNVSIRDGFNKGDYDYFRPGESTPRTQKEMIMACMQAYNRVGIVRNVIDLMADFAVQGLTLVHPNPRIEKFYKEWWRKVRGKERTERFLNLFYRAGNVIIRRHTAKLRQKDVQNLQHGTASPDHKEIKPSVRVEPREVPWSYTIMNPMVIEVMGGDLAPFIGPTAFVYAVQVPPTLIKKIKSPNSAAEKMLVKQLPAEIRDSIKDGLRLLPLSSDKIKVLYYKRDDWQVWAEPMTSAILDNLRQLKKMELADLAALDGAISQVRLWRLGSLEHKILPTEVAINRLADMLLNNVGGGVMDLVWGPELDLVETSTEVHRFLGESKYAPVLNLIYAGLGIPPTLTGTAIASGFTNNYISLKTLIERLQYGRDSVGEFWDHEIRLVQQAMNFRQPATLRFDRMALSDEAAEKALLVQLIDRDLISPETIQERFGEDPDIEEARMRRAARKRKQGSIPEKASPFHDPQDEQGMKKIFAQLGVLTPSEAGVDLDPKQPGQQSPLDQQAKMQQQQADQQAQENDSDRQHDLKVQRLQLKHGVHPNQLDNQAVKTGVSGQGRPQGKKDSKRRKQKTVKPRTAAGFLEALAWAEEAQQAVVETTAPGFLRSCGKKNLRQLSAEEARNFEDFRFAVLANLTPKGGVAPEVIARVVGSELTIADPLAKLLRKTLARYVERTGQQPGTDMLRKIQASVVALWHAEPADSESGVSPQGT